MNFFHFCATHCAKLIALFKDIIVSVSVSVSAETKNSFRFQYRFRPKRKMAVSASFGFGRNKKKPFGRTLATTNTVIEFFENLALLLSKF